MLPAETSASAFPSATARTAATSELSGFARTASAGFSCIPITSEVSCSSSPRASSHGPPNNTGSIPAARAANAPATISSGPRSLPIASTAMRAMSYGASIRSGSTSRPLYVPQFRQT